MFCGKCGIKLQDGAKFCGNCGAKVFGQVAEADNSKKNENIKNKPFTPVKIEIPKVKFTEVIPPIFEWARDFGEGLAAIQDIGDSGKTSVDGFIDTNGHIVIETKIRNAMSFSEGLCAVSDGKKWGFIDREGNVAIPYQYDEVGNFVNGYSLCKKDEQYVLIDLYGKEIHFEDYDSVFYNSEEMVVNVEKNGKEGLCSCDGNEIFPCNYESIVYHDGLIMADNYSEERNSDVYNISGKEVLHNVDISASNFWHHNDMICIKKNNLYGYYNREGILVIPHKYTSATNFFGGFAFVKEGNEWLSIDKNGDVISVAGLNNGNTRFDYVYDKVGEYGIVEKNSKYGFVDKYFNMVTDIKYDKSRGWEHRDGFYISNYESCSIGKCNGLIDKNGKEIIPCKYDSVFFPFAEEGNVKYGVIKVEHNDKEVYFDLNTGKELFTPGRYDWVGDFHEGYALVKKDEKYGYISCLPGAKALRKEDIGASKIDKEYIKNVKKQEKQELERSKKIEEGQVIEMGGFYWMVLNVVKSKGKALLLSKDCVSYGAYADTRYNNTEDMSTFGKIVFKLTGGQEETYIDDVVWANSAIRSFLNTSFYNKFFSDEEKNRILKTNINTTGKRSNHTYGGEDTSDKLFLLSIEEFKKYMYPGESSIALYNGVNRGWWLRSPGIDNETVASIDIYGEIEMNKYQFADLGIRPAMYIKI